MADKPQSQDNYEKWSYYYADKGETFANFKKDFVIDSKELSKNYFEEKSKFYNFFPCHDKKYDKEIVYRFGRGWVPTQPLTPLKPLRMRVWRFLKSFLPV